MKGREIDKLEERRFGNFVAILSYSRPISGIELKKCCSLQNAFSCLFSLYRASESPAQFKIMIHLTSVSNSKTWPPFSSRSLFVLTLEKLLTKLK